MNSLNERQPDLNKTPEPLLFNDDLPIALSAFTKSDLPLLYATWLESYRDAKISRCIRKNVYFSYLRLKIDELLRNPGLEVTKAHLAQDPDCIFGWSVSYYNCDTQTLILHYVFTKFKYRNLGIGNRLVKEAKRDKPAEIFYYTHRNNADNYLFTIPWLEQSHQMTYNPFLF